MSDWKIGMVLDYVPGETAEEKFALVAAAGFDGVEIPCLPDDDMRELYKNLAENSGLDIHGVIVTMMFRQNSITSDDPEVRQSSIDLVKASIATAAKTNAQTVLLVPGVVSADVTYEQAFERSVKEIKKLIPEAEKNNVLLAIENVWNKFLLSPIEFRRYIDAFDSNTVVSYFDTGNIITYGFPHHWIRTLGPTIKKVHAKAFHEPDHKFVGLLEGTNDWGAIVEALREIDYRGYITVEVRPQGDPLEGLKKIREDMFTIFGV